MGTQATIDMLAGIMPINLMDMRHMFNFGMGSSSGCSYVWWEGSYTHPPIYFLLYLTWTLAPNIPYHLTYLELCVLGPANSVHHVTICKLRYMLITICRALPERIKETLPLWSERVVARWRRSVASGEALVMLHRVMRSVLHRPTTMAIEMARDRGTFVRSRRLFRLL